jgi:hypothetical protein
MRKANVQDTGPSNPNLPFSLIVLDVPFFVSPIVRGCSLSRLVPTKILVGLSDWLTREAAAFTANQVPTTYPMFWHAEIRDMLAGVGRPVQVFTWTGVPGRDACRLGEPRECGWLALSHGACGLAWQCEPTQIWYGSCRQS